MTDFGEKDEELTRLDSGEDPSRGDYQVSMSSDPISRLPEADSIIDEVRK